AFGAKPFGEERNRPCRGIFALPLISRGLLFPGVLLLLAGPTVGRGLRNPRRLLFRSLPLLSLGDHLLDRFVAKLLAGPDPGDDLRLDALRGRRRRQQVDGCDLQIGNNCRFVAERFESTHVAACRSLAHPELSIEPPAELSRESRLDLMERVADLED